MPDAAHLVVTLVGCDHFEYQPYQQPPVSEPSAVVAVCLELLSAEVANGAVRVERYWSLWQQMHAEPGDARSYWKWFEERRMELPPE